MTNANNVSFNSSKMSSKITIIERSKMARQQYQEGIDLIDKLETLKEQVRLAQEALETHINNCESIDIDEVSCEIDSTSIYLNELNEELSQWDSSPNGSSSGSEVEEVTLPDMSTPLVVSKTITSAPASKKIVEELESKSKTIVEDKGLSEQSNNQQKLIDNLEDQLNNSVPSNEDKEEFILYFNRPYFLGNGVRMKKGDYMSLIKTINSKEDGNLEGKYRELTKLKEIHYMMFDDSCLADIDTLISELDYPF